MENKYNPSCYKPYVATWVNIILIIGVNLAFKSHPHCRAGSLCPAISDAWKQRAGTETRPYNKGGELEENRG